MYAEINLEYGMPKAQEAIAYLKDAVDAAKRQKVKYLLVIHGYGSTGKGGVICDKARKWLTVQRQNGKIKSLIYGEDFNIFNFEALRMKKNGKELEPLLKVCNNGVTVVEF